MDPEDLSWQEYKRLEVEFLKCCQYVHLAKDHFQVYSFEFMRLIAEIGMEFEAVSQQFVHKSVNAPELQGTDIPARVHSGRELKINHYRLAFETLFSASEREVNVLHIGQPLIPFYPPVVQNRSLPWWKAFTNLKHERITNFIESATLEVALNALSALFLVNLFFRVRPDNLINVPGPSLSEIFSVGFLEIRVVTSGVSARTYRIKTKGN